jgi:response regulator RpfG family c-di-GMP phosphodiesterase
VPAEICSSLREPIIPFGLAEKHPVLLVISPSRERFEALGIALRTRHYRLRAILDEAELKTYALEKDRPDLVVLDVTLLEQEQGHRIIHYLKSQSEWSAIPLIFAAPEITPPPENQKSPSARSLGVIDYLFTPSADEILVHHLEKIRYNIVKEDFVRVLILGNSSIASRLTGNYWPEWNRKRNHFKIIHIPFPTDSETSRGELNILSLALAKSPDIILIEMTRFLDASMLTLLEQLKSRIETKYIPIILIQSVHASDGHSLAALCADRNTPDCSSRRWDEPPQTIQCHGNLIKDVEYALRIKRQRGEQYRECL